jgi:hypothetical protein
MMRYEVLEGMPSQMPFGIQLDEPGGGLPLTAPDQCPPFHYATHYMSSAVVLHYLIRLQVGCRILVFGVGRLFSRSGRLTSVLV